jgi:DNA-3-methyladenine glycosylase
MLARWFLGKILLTNIDGHITAGIITETEAYAGTGDRASHAWGGRRSSRTAPMYMAGGVAYVYLIYGIYSLFNIVTGPAGIPHAVLVRAIKPIEGIGIMHERRKWYKEKGLADGPGKLAMAMGIACVDSGIPLCENRIWIEDRGIVPAAAEIDSGPRIGVDYAGKDALLPYRFIYKP